VLTMLGGLQALQGVPAALWGDRMAPLSCHPVRCCSCAARYRCSRSSTLRCGAR
jgi:hypothetical protein